MPRVQAALLPLTALLLPSAAAALVITFGGAVDGIVDPDNRLDGSVVNGTRMTGRYTVDPTPSGPGIGEVGAARLAFDLGSYHFEQSEDPHEISLFNDEVVGPGIVVDRWQTRLLVAAQLDPEIPQVPEGVGYGAMLQLFDGTATKITGAESDPFIVDDLAGWTTARLTLNALVSDVEGGVEIGPLQIQVALDQWEVVPEPGSLGLLGAGLLALAAGGRSTRRRRER